MPIYEYKAKNGSHCKLCRGRFEVRQGINDQPLRRCPECGAEIRKLFSRPFLLRTEALSGEETFDEPAGQEFDESGLEDDFAEDEVWA
jgi:putative FmdB family regulatory protein